MSDGARPQESVYNLLPKHEVPAPTPPRYVSKYRKKVVLEQKLMKDAMKTMGPPPVEAPTPDKYLRKHSKEPTVAEKAQRLKECRRPCAAKKPAVPARTEIPLMGIHSKRDFIKTPTAAVPVKPQPAFVDTCDGHKQLLGKSGLLPSYMKRKGYGEVPAYLQQRNEEERRAQEEYNSFVKEQMEQRAMKHMTDEERQAVLEGLKKNWDQLHHEYQGLSLVIDTMPKKYYKERLEMAMKKLESDINLFERSKTIYIPNI